MDQKPVQLAVQNLQSVTQVLREKGRLDAASAVEAICLQVCNAMQVPYTDDGPLRWFLLAELALLRSLRRSVCQQEEEARLDSDISLAHDWRQGYELAIAAIGSVLFITGTLAMKLDIDQLENLTVEMMTGPLREAGIALPALMYPDDLVQ